MEGGARAVHYLVECETGADSPVLEIFDGSGLSVLNRTNPRTTVRLLSYMADSPMWDNFWETLPEAGDAQGLKRMYRTGAERNLRAKTGTIDHVSALSGYVRAANGERLAFSIMSNNVPSTWRAKRVEDAIGARLASFTRPTAGGMMAGSAALGGSLPVPAQPTAAPATRSAAVYRIRRGDTLEGIAKRHRTTVSALQRANPGIDPRRLIPGRTITLP
jgi:D-alanyl-D-alanine carboxypeptidase/D-alanyl-D-alanine-endopeptidase (penicillin-binding protein 4)